MKRKNSCDLFTLSRILPLSVFRSEDVYLYDHKTFQQPQLGFILALRVKQRMSASGFSPAGLPGLQTRQQRSLLSQAFVTFG